MAKKQNKIVRFTQELLSKPHLITRESFDTITTYLDNRNKGILIWRDGSEYEDENNPKAEIEPHSFSITTEIGVIDIVGALTNKPVETECGEVGISYQGILETAEELIESGAKTIILNISSGGGEAYNCFDSVNSFRKMCDEAGVYVYAYVDECAASAAYAWACAADEVISHPMAEVGSIGVLVCLTDYSKAMEQEGIKAIYIFAGENKVPYAEDGSFKKSFIDELQQKVDVLYAEFVNHVKDYTGLSVEQIKATEASTFIAKDALSLGLINKIMNYEEFTRYIVDMQKPEIIHKFKGLNND